MNPDRKFLKSAVGFEHPASGMDQCRRCVHFIPEQERCNIVQGEVKAGDWCRKFKKGGPS